MKTAELEIVGSPSWQWVLPVQNTGLIYFTKTDQTKAKIVSFDADLVKRWEKDIYLDAERAPTAYTLDSNQITFLFRETSGMYYQAFVFDLHSGEFVNRGFEIREYFSDQDYVFLNDKIILGGYNEKGGAFYVYDIKTERGKLIENVIPGKASLQQFKWNKQKNRMESIWAVKTVGYAQERKKKGEFTKDAFVSYIEFDTECKQLLRSDLKSSKGYFPMSAKTLHHGSKTYFVGTYQTNLGDKGMYMSDMSVSSPTLKYFPYQQLLSDAPSLTAEELRSLYTQFNFLQNKPLTNGSQVQIGGVFWRPQYRTVSEQVYDPNAMDTGFGNRWSRGLGNNTRTQNREVFQGYWYPYGMMASVDLDKMQLLESHRIDLKQLSPEVKETLSYNNLGSMAYCVNGDLATKNFNIGNAPILYKLSEFEADAKSKNYVPRYQEVRHWYENYFIADGAKSKIEVLPLENSIEVEEKGLFRKRKKRPQSYTQIRKTIYLTKIASGG
ncbi:MAG: hypothetical protein ACRCVT_15245 [Leadbetterella sp.]